MSCVLAVMVRAVSCRCVRESTSEQFMRIRSPTRCASPCSTRSEPKSFHACSMVLTPWSRTSRAEISCRLWPHCCANLAEMVSVKPEISAPVLSSCTEESNGSTVRSLCLFWCNRISDSRTANPAMTQVTATITSAIQFLRPALWCAEVNSDRDNLPLAALAGNNLKRSTPSSLADW